MADLRQSSRAAQLWLVCWICMLLNGLSRVKASAWLELEDEVAGTLASGWFMIPLTRFWVSPCSCLGPPKNLLVIALPRKTSFLPISWGCCFAESWVKLSEIVISVDSWRWAILLLSGRLAIMFLQRRAPKSQPLKNLLAGRAAVWVLPHALCDEVCHPLWTLLRHPASTPGTSSRVSGDRKSSTKGIQHCACWWMRPAGYDRMADNPILSRKVGLAR